MDIEKEWPGEKVVVPPYYHRFHCIADKCRHTCCAGWEIDIDQVDLERFQQMTGPLGEKLKACIETENGYAHFRLLEGERCPFLNEKNLCEMILQYGEEAVCRICREHPRFVNEAEDHLEVGLGMCCEAAAEVILTWPDPQGKPNVKYPMDIHFLLGLQRMDEAWTDCLLRIRKYRLSGERVKLPQSPEWRLAWRNLYDYIVFRYHDTVYADWVCSLIKLCCRALLWQKNSIEFADLVEICRLYSSEIEYSDKNVPLIMQKIRNMSVGN